MKSKQPQSIKGPKNQRVYIICLDTVLSDKAKHYIGYTRLSAYRRLLTHRAGAGSKMLAAANEKGITYRISRVYTGKDRAFERWLKNKKKIALFCPICNEKIKKLKYKLYKK